MSSRNVVSVGLVLSLVAGCHGAPSLPAVRPAAAPLAGPVVLASAPDVASIVARVSPAVVSITAVRASRLPRRLLPPSRRAVRLGWPQDRRLRRTRKSPPSSRRGKGPGYLIVDPEGHVVTNAHVVDGATAVRVRLADDRDFEATVRGRDTWLDVAVLEIRGAKGLPSARRSAGAPGSGWESPSSRSGDPYTASAAPSPWASSAPRAGTSGWAPSGRFPPDRRLDQPGKQRRPALFTIIGGRVVGINTAIHPARQGARLRHPHRRREGRPPAAPRQGARRPGPAGRDGRAPRSTDGEGARGGHDEGRLGDRGAEGLPRPALGAPRGGRHRQRRRRAHRAPAGSPARRRAASPGVAGGGGSSCAPGEPPHALDVTLGELTAADAYGSLDLPGGAPNRSSLR